MFFDVPELWSRFYVLISRLLVGVVFCLSIKHVDEVSISKRDLEDAQATV